ncbi:MAG: winged helix-turn-helix transcriptional regulator [Alphaproteobacteria bacterium]|nr:winged helix-turn-helix transcriptional regulator [Alphaproteobacteria bacterium]MBV9905119.1 winged helix-turn-helix transcriptional regulator [Alphaproteobacteria bacterium]
MRSNAARKTQQRLDLPPKARLDLEHFLPYRLSVLSNRVSDAIARQYSDRFGLTIPEWRVMAVLGGTPDLSARDVAERTAMDKVQVSRAVESLVKARRVARTADRDDGRIQRLALTTKGRAIYDEVVPLALHLEEIFLSALEPAERRQFDALMAKLARQAHLLGH